MPESLAQSSSTVHVSAQTLGDLPASLESAMELSTGSESPAGASVNESSATSPSSGGSEGASAPSADVSTLASTEPLASELPPAPMLPPVPEPPPPSPASTTPAAPPLDPAVSPVEIASSPAQPRATLATKIQGKINRMAVYSRPSSGSTGLSAACTLTAAPTTFGDISFELAAAAARLETGVGGGRSKLASFVSP